MLLIVVDAYTIYVFDVFSREHDLCVAEAHHEEAIRVLEQGRTFLLNEGASAATATGRVLLILATFYADRCEFLQMNVGLFLLSKSRLQIAVTYSLLCNAEQSKIDGRCRDFAGGQ